MRQGRQFSSIKGKAMNRPNALPTITISKVEYFVDFRLEEIRPCNAPFLAIWFDDLDEKYKAQIRGIRTTETSIGHVPTLDN